MTWLRLYYVIAGATMLFPMVFFLFAYRPRGASKSIALWLYTTAIGFALEGGRLLVVNLSRREVAPEYTSGFEKYVVIISTTLIAIAAAINFGVYIQNSKWREQ